MGYYATGSGHAILKKDTDLNEFVHQINEREYNRDYHTALGQNSDHQTEFTWDESDDHWKEESLLKFLEFLAPYITSGRAVYQSSGEGDDAHWSYTFDGSDWIGRTVNVIYDDDLSGISDDVLIAELRKRGYAVKHE